MKKIPFTKALIFSSVALVAFMTPAQAGFQWKGPITPPMAQQPAAPVDNAMKGLEPVTNWKGQTELAAPIVPVAPAVPVAPVVAPVEATPVVAPAPVGEVVSGFGSGVPLVMALQQVVPAGYQFSFSSGVNPGASVSWQGGKPWQAVLGDMLATQNLGFLVQNNVVVVGDFPPPAPVLAPVPAPAPAPVVMQAPSKADQIPADMIDGTKQAAPEAQKPVDIRREKPAKTFWQRITGSLDDNANDAAPRTAAAEKVETNNIYAGMAAPKHAATDSSDVRAMNAARAMNAKGTENDMSAPPESVVHPAVTSMADQAMAGAVVTSTVPAGNSNWGQPNQSTAAPTSIAAATAPKTISEPALTAVPAVPAPAVESPRPLADQHVVDLTATESPAPASAPVASAPVASAPVASAPVASAPMKGSWMAQKGDTLRDVLKAWSDSAGVQLYWSIDYNYRVSKPVAFTGAYDEAVRDLLNQFSAVRPQPYGQLHQSADGPRVLVVKSYDLAP